MIYDITKIDDYTEDELESFKSKEESKQESGEVLLDALLKTPFKSKEKVDKILEQIGQHKLNILLIGGKISEQTNTNWSFGYAGGGVIVTGSTTTTTTTNGTNGTTWNTALAWANNSPNEENIQVEYIDLSNNVNTIYVIDDVIQSVFGEYYLISQQQHIPLKRVISIDENSNVGKWYSTMCKNFEREIKLKRVLKDETKNK